MKGLKGIFPPVYFFSFAAAALALSLVRPMYNWDMIAYVAAAKSFEERDGQALHTFTYGEVKRTLSERQYRNLAPDQETGAQTPYYARMSRDAAAFSEQLPFYQIRPIYTGAIYLLHKLGVAIVRATCLISGIAVFLGMLLLYPVSKSCLPGKLFLVTPPLAVVLGVMDLARLSTPDGLAFLGVLVVVFLLVKGRVAWILLALPVLVGMRTDLVLYVIPVYALIGFREPRLRGLAAASALFSLLAYFMIVSYWSHPGWGTTLYFTLVELQAHPVSSPPVLTAATYLRQLAYGMLSVIRERVFVLYLIMAFFSFRLMWKAAKSDSLKSVFSSLIPGLIIVSCGFIGAHFILFPVIMDRFFTAHYLIGAMGFLSLAAKGCPHFARKEKDGEQPLAM